MPTIPPVTACLPSPLRARIGAAAAARSVPLCSVLAAVLVMAATRPPAEPQPRWFKRTRLPGGEHYTPLAYRYDALFVAAERLLVPEHFENRSDAMTWAANEYLPLLDDYYGNPDEAAALRADILARAPLYTPPAWTPAVRHAPPSPPRDLDMREGPCPACAGGYPRCALCLGTGKIIRTVKQWVAIHGCSPDDVPHIRKDGRPASEGAAKPCPTIRKATGLRARA